MGALLFVTEFLSLYLMFQRVGFLLTMSALTFSFVLGLFVLQRQGLGVLRDLQTGKIQDFAGNSVVLNRLTKMIAGLLLMVPGFASDILALMLLFPLTRPLFHRMILSWLRRLQGQGRVKVYTRTAASEGPREIRDVTPPTHHLTDGNSD